MTFLLTVWIFEIARSEIDLFTFGRLSSLIMSYRVYMNFIFSMPTMISFIDVKFKTTIRAAN